MKVNNRIKIVITLSFILFLCSPVMHIVSLSKLLYIPADHYSLLNISHQTSQTISNLYNINISLYLGQITELDQSNSVFDYVSADISQFSQFMACYQDSINHLSNLYRHYQPCQSTCNFENIQTLNYNTRQTQFNHSIRGDQNYNESFIIDNTFFPCQNGTYQPVLTLSQEIHLTIQSNLEFQWIIKLVFILLLQIMILLLAYILIMCNKLNKKRDKYIKLKQQSQVNKFFVDSFIKKESSSQVI